MQRKLSNSAIAISVRLSAWLGFVIAIAGLLYVAGYVLLVKRVEVVQPITLINGNKGRPAEIHCVYADTPKSPVIAHFFSPMLKLDWQRIRPDRWRSFVVIETNGTLQTNDLNLVYSASTAKAITNLTVMVLDASWLK